MELREITITGPLANIPRNVALHFSTPSRGVNARIELPFRFAIRMLGEDPDNPDVVWPTVKRFVVPYGPLWSNEFHTGNPFHFILIVAGVLLLCRRRREASLRNARLLAYGVIAAFVMFCATLS